MPEPFVVTVHARAVGGLDRLPAIDAKLDQPAHPHASAGDRVIAPGPVASFTAVALEIVARLELEKPPHFGFGKFAREIQVASVAIHAADVFGLCEVADIAIERSRIREHAGSAHEATGERYRDDASSAEHATSLWQHRGGLARARTRLTVRRVTEMLDASRGEVREFGLTGLTRNQVSLTAPGVRIPPSPPISPVLLCLRSGQR